MLSPVLCPTVMLRLVLSMLRLVLCTIVIFRFVSTFPKPPCIAAATIRPAARLSHRIDHATRRLRLRRRALTLNQILTLARQHTGLSLPSVGAARVGAGMPLAQGRAESIERPEHGCCRRAHGGYGGISVGGGAASTLLADNDDLEGLHLQL